MAEIKPKNLIKPHGVPVDYRSHDLDYSYLDGVPIVTTYPEIYRDLKNVFCKSVGGAPVTSYDKPLAIYSTTGSMTAGLYVSPKAGEHLIQAVRGAPDIYYWDYRGWENFVHQITIKRDEWQRFKDPNAKAAFLERLANQFSITVAQTRDMFYSIIFTKWSWTEWLDKSKADFKPKNKVGDKTQEIASASDNVPTNYPWTADERKKLFDFLGKQIALEDASEVLAQIFGRFICNDKKEVAAIKDFTITLERLLGYHKDEVLANPPFEKPANDADSYYIGARGEIPAFLGVLLVINGCIYKNKIEVEYKADAKNQYFGNDEEALKLYTLWNRVNEAVEEIKRGHPTSYEKYNIKRLGSTRTYNTNGNKTIADLLTHLLTRTQFIPGLNHVSQERKYGTQQMFNSEISPGMFYFEDRDPSNLYVLINPVTLSRMRSKLKRSEYPNMFTGEFNGANILPLENIEPDDIILIHRNTLNEHIIKEGTGRDSYDYAKLDNISFHWSQCFGLAPYTCAYFTVKKRQ